MTMPTIPLDLVLIVIIGLMIAQLVVSVKILSRMNGSTSSAPATKKPSVRLTFNELKGK